MSEVEVGDWVTLRWCCSVIGPRVVREVDDLMGRLIVEPGLNIRTDEVVEVRKSVAGIPTT